MLKNQKKGQAVSCVKSLKLMPTIAWIQVFNLFLCFQNRERQNNKET